MLYVIYPDDFIIAANLLHHAKLGFTVRLKEWGIFLECNHNPTMIEERVKGIEIIMIMVIIYWKCNRYIHKNQMQNKAVVR